MDIKAIKELITQVNDSELTEFNLELDGTAIRMSKNTYHEPFQKASTEVIAAPQTVITPTEVASSEATNVNNEKSGTIVKSPIVGVVYLAPSPDKPVFKKVGDKIAVGETLCIVEAMKLMNEIKSDVAGTIAEVLVENEQVVEYDQPLFNII